MKPNNSNNPANPARVTISHVIFTHMITLLTPAYPGICIDGPDVCLISEHMPRGSLHEVLVISGLLSRPEDLPVILQMAVDASAGLMHLHHEGVKTLSSFVRLSLLSFFPSH